MSADIVRFFKAKLTRDVFGMMLAFLECEEFYGTLCCHMHRFGAPKVSFSCFNSQAFTILADRDREVYQGLYWKYSKRSPVPLDLIRTDNPQLLRFMGPENCLPFIDAFLNHGCFRVVYTMFTLLPSYLKPSQQHLLRAIRSGCLMTVQYFVESHKVELNCRSMVSAAINARSISLLTYFLERTSCPLEMHHFTQAMRMLKREENLALSATFWPGVPVQPPSAEIVRFIVNCAHIDYLHEMLVLAQTCQIRCFDLNAYILCRLLLRSQRLFGPKPNGTFRNC